MLAAGALVAHQLADILVPDDGSVDFEERAAARFLDLGDRDLRAQSPRRNRDARAKGPNARHLALASALCGGHSHEAHRRHHFVAVSEVGPVVFGGFLPETFAALAVLDGRQRLTRAARDAHARMVDLRYFGVGDSVESGPAGWLLREIAQ